MNPRAGRCRAKFRLLILGLNKHAGAAERRKQLIDCVEELDNYVSRRLNIRDEHVNQRSRCRANAVADQLQRCRHAI